MTPSALREAKKLLRLVNETQKAARLTLLRYQYGAAFAETVARKADVIAEGRRG